MKRILSVLTAICVFFGTFSVFPQIKAAATSISEINQYITAYYSFEDSDNLGKDFSGLSRHAVGEYNVGVTDGISGKALVTYGTDSYMHLSDDVLVDNMGSVTESFTLSLWLNRHSSIGDSFAVTLHSTPTYGFPDDYLGLISKDRGYDEYGNNNLLTFEFRKDKVTENTVLVAGTNPVGLNEWAHYALSYDANADTASLYVNGSVVAVDYGVTLTPADLTNQNNFLGKSAWDWDVGYTGAFDEVRFYSTALSASEINLIRETDLAADDTVNGTNTNFSYLSESSATRFLRMLSGNAAYKPKSDSIFYNLLIGNYSGQEELCAMKSFVAFVYYCMGEDIYAKRLSALQDVMMDGVPANLKEAAGEILQDETISEFCPPAGVMDDTLEYTEIILQAICASFNIAGNADFQYFKAILGQDQSYEYFDLLADAVAIYNGTGNKDIIDDWANLVYEFEQSINGTAKETTGTDSGGSDSSTSVVSYQIVFDSNCSDVSDISYTYYLSTDNWYVPTMSRSGYVFGGWYWDAACTNSAAGDIYINRNLTFYAKWVARYHTITLKSNCTDISDITRTYDITDSDSWDIPSLPERRGYIFGGWYWDSACTNPVTTYSRLQDNVFYAKWNKTHTVFTLKSNCSSVADMTFVAYKEDGTTITLPHGNRNGYIFKGYYFDQSCTQDATGMKFGTDYTLYAKWLCLYDYTVENNEATITDMTSYLLKDGVRVTDITIPDKFDNTPVTKIGSNAFDYTELTSVVIPSSVKEICSNAFYSNSNLKKVTMGNGVEVIGYGAFDSCKKLETINIPSSVKTIGSFAFDSCAIKNLTIPASVTSIESLAFSNCDDLNSITVASGNSNYYAENNVIFSKDKTKLIMYLNNSNTFYKIPEGVKTIAENAFYDKSLQRIEISEGVEKIESYAFRFCNSLSEVLMPSSIETICDNSFATCWNLRDIYYFDKDGKCSEDDWNNISIGETNANLIGANIHYDCILAESIGFDDPKISLAAGNRLKLNVDNTNAEILPQNATFDGIKWTSSDESVAVVKNGILTGVKNGSATISAKTAFSDVASSFSVTITGRESMLDSDDVVTFWTTPDGDLYDANVASVWNGWTSEITSGFANIRTYDTGNTLQFYSLSGQECVAKVNSPGYGEGAEKIIIEWYHKSGFDTGEPSNHLYFDFSFKDLNETEIAYLKLDKNFTEVTEEYDMGFPADGTRCTIVAYNNSDGNTHTADYYLGGELVMTESDLEGVISGFKSIEASNGLHTDMFYHIGFADLKIGGVEAKSVSGICGSNIEWILATDGVLTISGVGDMNGYSAVSEFPWYPYAEKITAVIIEDGITSISNNAFRGYENIVSVCLGGVKTIGVGSFRDCSKLECIYATNSLTTISNYAFYNCNNLTNVEFEGVQAEWEAVSIGTYNTNLTDVTVEYMEETETPTDAETDEPTEPEEEEDTPEEEVTEVLWSCPEGTFMDTDVSSAFSGWNSDITSGFVNVITYNVGNTLQFYTDGTTECVTTVTSPGYGAGAEKIIIEWDQKTGFSDTTLTPANLYFDFSFKDLNGTEIAFLKFDKNYTNVDETYNMGYPANGAHCVLIAYNNTDGLTHTAEYYVDGSLVMTESSLEGVIDGFKSIESSNGRFTTKYYHVGFANLKITGTTKPETETPTEPTFEGAEGTCGNNLTWVIDTNGVITVSGSGAMASYSSVSEFPWYEYAENITSVVIEEGITSISNNAFRGYTNLESVVIGDGVETIGIGSFRSCSALSEITMTDTVTTISNYAFSGCSSLATVNFTGEETAWSNISIGTYNTALEGAEVIVTEREKPEFSGAEGACGKNLKWTLTADGVLTVTGAGTMAGYSSVSTFPWYEYAEYVTSVVIGDGVTSVANNAFRAYENLEKVTIGKTVLLIGIGSFRNCMALTEIDISKSVTTIEKYAFASSSNLEVVNYEGTAERWADISVGTGNSALSNAEISVNDRVFEGAEGTCGKNLTWTLTTDGVLTISGVGAMSGYSSIGAFPWYEYSDYITKVVIEDGVTSISNNAFRGYVNIESVKIGNSVHTIGVGSFRGDSGIKEVSITKTMATVNNYAFYGCTALERVNFAGEETDWAAVNIGTNNTPLTDAEIVFE